jgi:hypothetical protein
VDGIKQQQQWQWKEMRKSFSFSEKFFSKIICEIHNWNWERKGILGGEIISQGFLCHRCRVIKT